MMTTPSTIASPSRIEWPVYEEDEIEAVLAVLHSGQVNYWTGTVCREFEQEYARYFGVQHAIALMNGTVALELALDALGIGPGDEVIVSPRTFIATASSVVMRGATPVCCDVDRDSGNITAETIAPAITPRTKAVIPVHLGGWPCEMPAIVALAHAHGLKVIEDCAQTHGAQLRGQYAGSFGDIAAWSFCQDKIISTGGEGGMVTVNDPALWSPMWSMKDHGKSWDAVYQREHAPGFRWLHESFGTNGRMTEMQGAIGRLQLQKLSGWVEKRRRLAGIVEQTLAPLAAVRIPTIPAHVYHAYYRCYVYLRPEALKDGWDQTRLMTAISEQGCKCAVGSCGEIYREKAFTDAGFQPTERLPVARELGETSLAFLVHHTQSEVAVADRAEIAARVIAQATR